MGAAAVAGTMELASVHVKSEKNRGSWPFSEPAAVEIFIEQRKKRTQSIALHNDCGCTTTAMPVAMAT